MLTDNTTDKLCNLSQTSTKQRYNIHT